MRQLLRDRLVPVMLRRVGVAPAPRSRFLSGQRSFLIGEFNLTTVLDIGANVGQYGGRLRSGGFAGAIHSFEPGRAAYDQLAAAAARDAAWQAHQLAVGAESGSAVLHNWAGAASEIASLREPSDGMRGMHGEPAAEEVQVVSLAHWLERHPEVDPGRTLLKVDVQGSEREVLLGAGKHLPRFPVVEIEAPLAYLYEGEAALPELLTLLAGEGFLPASIVTERFHTGWRGAADVDVLAIRKDLSRLPV